MDDDPLLRKATTLALFTEGHRVTAASDGPELKVIELSQKGKADR